MKSNPIKKSIAPSTTMEDKKSQACEIEVVVESSAVNNTVTSRNQSSGNNSSRRNHEFTIRVSSKPLITSILTKLHAGYFRISLSLGGQALLWKTLLQPNYDDSNPLIHVFHLLHPNAAYTVFWFFSLFILLLLSLLYILRSFFHFHLVKAEFLHHVGVNYLFAPWISWFLILQSAPSIVNPKTKPFQILWWIVAVPVLALDVKIYGQWFTKGKNFLSTVANPTSQLSVIGNLVGARAAAQMGWTESAVFLFSLGMVHYLVLFVTLYQRFSGSDRIPASMKPVFFLFFAAPSMASLAWDSIAGSFDTASKMLFSLSMFLFVSLVCRPIMFKKAMRRFNVAWWAYSFPVTFLALASSEYAQEVKSGVAQVLMVLLLALSVLVSLGLMVLTLLNPRMLLPDKDPFTSLFSQFQKAT